MPWFYYFIMLLVFISVIYSFISVLFKDNNKKVNTYDILISITLITELFFLIFIPLKADISLYKQTWSLEKDISYVEFLTEQKRKLEDSLLLPVQNIDYDLKCFNEIKYYPNEYKIKINTIDEEMYKYETCYYTENYLENKLNKIQLELDKYSSIKELEKKKEVLESTTIFEWWNNNDKS